MRRGQHPARADQDAAAAAARAGTEIAAEMDDGVPGELSRPDFLDAAVDRAETARSPSSWLSHGAFMVSVPALRPAARAWPQAAAAPASAR